MTADTQVCATPGCDRPGAFKTRTQPTYCSDCIDAMYFDGGLVPLEAFTARRARRLTACAECHVELTYPLDYVMEQNRFGQNVCRVCFWGEWGAMNRRNLKTELDDALGRALAAGAVGEELQQLIASSEPVQQSIYRWWWPTERTRATVALLHHDLVLDTVEHNDGMDPVVVRCQLCGFASVKLPGRMDAEMQGRWCSCPSCQARNKGACAADVALGFEARGLTVEDPLPGADTVQAARCKRCETPRRISGRQLNRGQVPCFVCDGAADPRAPHRVYLFHFPTWNAYKVGITNAHNDTRLKTHLGNGGRLLEIVEVPHRAAALWMEAEVLALVTAWPVAGEPFERRVTGWTEMWDASAPVNVKLADYLPAAASVSMDPALVADWQHSRTVATEKGAWVPAVGDRVCFTGTGVGATRREWQARARGAGLQPVSEVSAAVAALVCADPERVTEKVRRAAALGVPVVTYEQFVSALPLTTTT